jgi:hypothetical protein
MYEFTTPNIELDLIDRLPEMSESSSCYRQKVTLKWSVEFEMREWGIKSCIITVPEQEITFEIELDERDDFETKTVTVLLKEIHTDVSDQICLNLVPRKLEFYRGKWTLSF